MRGRAKEVVFVAVSVAFFPAMLAGAFAAFMFHALHAGWMAGSDALRWLLR